MKSKRANESYMLELRQNIQLLARLFGVAAFCYHC